MANQSATLADLFGSSLAFPIFALFVFVPGYVLGSVSGVLGFRRRALAFRIVAAPPLSIAVFPALTYLVGLAFAMPGIAVLYALTAIAFAVILARAAALGGRWRELRTHALPFAAAVAWAAVCLATLVDLQLGDGLYFPTVAYDYTTRTALTAEISRTGVPPHNPFFYPGEFVPLRYHYFWYLVCSLVDQAGGDWVGPRHAIIAGTAWTGLALMCIVALYIGITRDSPSRLLRTTGIGLALLAVTGLDIVPTLMLRATIGLTYPDMEWWNNAFMAWVHAALWVPHHLVGLVACLVGFLLCWTASGSRRHFLVSTGAAGMAFATAFGTSVYVVFVFGIFLGCWAAVSLVKRRLADTLTVAAAGMFAAAFGAPYLLAVHGSQSAANALQFTVRSFNPAEFALFDRGYYVQPLVALTNLALLPVNYFFELGAFGLLAAVTLRRFARRGWQLSRLEMAETLMAGASLVVCTFLSMSNSNDLGWRGVLPAQFIFLIWSADLLAEWQGSDKPSAAAVRAVSPRLRQTVAILIMLGIVGSMYEVLIVRFFPVLQDLGSVPAQTWLSEDHLLGKRTRALRQAYEWLDGTLPARAIVQANPDNKWDLFHGLYAHRQTVAYNRECVVGFGGDLAACEPIETRLASFFSTGEKAAGAFGQVCRDLSIDAFVAKDTDPVFSDPLSWASQRKPDFSNTFARVFLCPDRQGTSH